jgi:hypothetical protein
MDKLLISKETAVQIALSMYLDEPCRICGELIKDITGVVYTGYSKDNKSRSAHGKCWKKNIPQAQWAHPE